MQTNQPSWHVKQAIEGIPCVASALPVKKHHAPRSTRAPRTKAGNSSPKSEFVKKLQHRGERMAFVGDGINDTAALEQADLGIAVARVSDLAREAADIILLRSDIDVVLVLRWPHSVS